MLDEPGRLGAVDGLGRTLGGGFGEEGTEQARIRSFLVVAMVTLTVGGWSAPPQTVPLTAKAIGAVLAPE